MRQDIIHWGAACHSKDGILPDESSSQTELRARPPGVLQSMCHETSLRSLVKIRVNRERQGLQRMPFGQRSEFLFTY